MIEVSLFASAVRPILFRDFLNSLRNTKINVEVVFAGNFPMKLALDDPWTFPENVKYKYIQTGNIKPAQCYEIARRACTGETVMWVADDCEFPNNVLGRAYHHWKGRLNDKLILSVQTSESGYGNGELKLFEMNHHRFFGYRTDVPLMAPIGLMGRVFLNELGGLDRRYICGQYENDIVMRAYAAGGTVEIFGDDKTFVEIDHLRKSIQIGECKDRHGFLHRPFASGYEHDRHILETSWVKDSNPTLVRNDEFEPYDEKDLLTVSQSYRGKWE